LKSIKIMTMFLIALMTLPLVAYAVSHQDHDSHGHEKAAEMDHHGEMKHHDDNNQTSGTASSENSMIVVGSMVSKGSRVWRTLTTCPRPWPKWA